MLRKLQPKFYSRFDLLNDSRLDSAQAPLQFYDGNTADSLGVESARLQSSCLVGNFKARASQSSSAWDITHDEISDAQKQARARLLSHAEINQPQFPTLGGRHAPSSSRSYSANISPDALIIC